MKKLKFFLAWCLLLAVCLIPLSACGDNESGHIKHGKNSVVYKYEIENIPDDNNDDDWHQYYLTILFDPDIILQEQYYYYPVSQWALDNSECKNIAQFLEKDGVKILYNLSVQNRQAREYIYFREIHCVILYATKDQNGLDYLDIIYFQ